MPAEDAERRPILISEARHGLPFSKGLMAQSFMATGMVPSRAYAVAAKLEKEIRATGKERISTELLHVPGIAGVFYDLTHKPPGTIEWE